MAVSSFFFYKLVPIPLLRQSDRVIVEDAEEDV